MQFWSLSSEVVEAFAAVFPEFSKFPQRPSPTLDECPIRNDPRRCRLKVAGYRAIYQIRHGRPVGEAILARSERTCQDFASHVKRL